MNRLFSHICFLFAFVVSFPFSLYGAESNITSSQEQQSNFIPLDVSKIEIDTNVTVEEGMTTPVTPLPVKKVKSVYELWAEYAFRKPYNGSLPGQMPLDPAFSSAKNPPKISSAKSSSSSSATKAPVQANSTNVPVSESTATDAKPLVGNNSNGVNNASAATGNVSQANALPHVNAIPANTTIPMEALPAVSGEMVINGVLVPNAIQNSSTDFPTQPQPQNASVGTMNGAEQAVQNLTQNATQNLTGNAPVLPSGNTTNVTTGTIPGLSIIENTGPIPLTPEQKALIQVSTTLITPQDLTDTTPEPPIVLRDPGNTPEAMEALIEKEKGKAEQERIAETPLLLQPLGVPPFPGN